MQVLVPADRRFPAFLLPWQDAITTIKRILTYTSQPFHVGNWHISSVIGLIAGILIFVVALFLSRTIRTLLERRIAKRTYIDPGVRYTLARLANYFIIAVGVLAALKVAFENFDLTSIAVVFTALSVGIGFGLQYIAADIASGFILLFERPIRVGGRR